MRDIAADMGDANLMDRPPGETQLLDFAGAGYPPIVSIAVLAGLSVVCVFVLLRRVTKPVRI